MAERCSRLLTLPFLVALAVACAPAQLKPPKEIKPVQGGVAQIRFWPVVEHAEEFFSDATPESRDEFIATLAREVDDAITKAGLQYASEAAKGDVLLKVQSNGVELRFDLWNDHGGQIDSGLIPDVECFATYGEHAPIDGGAPMRGTALTSAAWPSR